LRGDVVAEAAVELVPVALAAQRQRHLARHAARQLEEREQVLPAHAARLSSVASASRLAALGLTSQNLPTKSRNSARMRALHALPVSSAWRVTRPVRCWR